jgi:hypothetical protein
MSTVTDALLSLVCGKLHPPRLTSLVGAVAQVAYAQQGLKTLYAQRARACT